MPPPVAAPVPEELIELAAKYRTLADLRARKDRADQPGTARATLRGLADRYPGCLRELDTLGAVELGRRVDALRAAAAGGPLEAWMSWILTYHRLMRASLAIKRRLAGASPHPRLLPALADEASQVAGLALDTDFVQAVARPPERRLGVVVLRRLEALFGTPARTIADALFPLRRPSPYSLS